MKKSLFVQLFICFTLPTFAQVNTNTLDQITGYLAQVNNINVSGKIVADHNKAGGVAAIGCSGNYCVIYASPHAMRQKSTNTWAFIMGHELAHYYLGHGGCGQSKYKEFEADRVGAQMAVNAGYNIGTYINALSREPNTCSASHGCWSERIYRLKKAFNYRANRSRRHNRCGIALSVFPFLW